MFKVLVMARKSRTQAEVNNCLRNHEAEDNYISVGCVNRFGKDKESESIGLEDEAYED